MCDLWGFNLSKIGCIFFERIEIYILDNDNIFMYFFLERRIRGLHSFAESNDKRIIPKLYVSTQFLTHSTFWLFWWDLDRVIEIFDENGFAQFV